MEYFRIDHDDGIAICTMHNPPMNYLTAPMTTELGQLLAEWAADRRVRVVALSAVHGHPAPECQPMILRPRFSFVLAMLSALSPLLAPSLAAQPHHVTPAAPGAPGARPALYTNLGAHHYTITVRVRMSTSASTPRSPRSSRREKSTARGVCVSVRV